MFVTEPGGSGQKAGGSKGVAIEVGGLEGGARGEAGAVRRYWEYLSQAPDMTAIEVERFAGICEQLVREEGGLVEAVKAVRGVHPGKAGPHLDPKKAAAATEGVVAHEVRERLIEMLTNGAPVPVEPEEQRRGKVVPPLGSMAGHEAEMMGTIWKDARRGGALIFKEEVAAELLQELEYSPLGRVDKRDHLGNIKDTGRLIHNITHGGEMSVNARTTRKLVPEIVLVGVGHVLRSVLYWRAVVPEGTPIMLTKRDVEGAFRRIPLEAEGVVFFGAAIDGYVVVMLVLPFGWMASPGHYGVASCSISTIHRGRRPANVTRDGPWPFESHTYMDDGMVVEPKIGRRLVLSALCYEEAAETILGVGAISQDKKDEEGEWAVVAIILGLLLDTAAGRLSLPASKLERLRVMLEDHKWRRGGSPCTLREVQELVGRLVHFTTVFPPARAFLSGLLRMLSERSRPNSGRVPREVMEEWYDDLEWLRTLIKTVSSWSMPISVPAAVVLSPGEWTRHGAGGSGYAYVGADATEWSYAVFNIDTGEYLQEYLSEAERATIRKDTKRRRAGEKVAPPRGSRSQRTALYIGVIELAALVHGALRWGAEWRDKMVVFITDSNNALGWIRKGRARNGYAAHLLRLLARLQLCHGFQVWAERVPSEENEIPDCASRWVKADGTPDEGERRRWSQLLQAYTGKKLRRVRLRPEERRCTRWLDLRHQDTRALRLPGEEGEETPPMPQRVALPSGGGRCGGRLVLGRPRQGVVPQEDDDTDGEQEQTRRARGRGVLPDRTDGDYQDLVRREMAGLLEEGIAPGTLKAYRRQYDDFAKFCHDWQRPCPLTGRHPEEDEETLMLYATEIGVVRRLKSDTVGVYLAGVRWGHLFRGHTPPLENKRERLKYLMKGLKSRDGDKDMRDPVTPEMLRLAKRRIPGVDDLGVATWAAIMVGFGFMMRAGEYLAYKDGSFDAKKAIRWRGVVFRRDGQRIWPGAEDLPDEVAIHFPGSKTDQYNTGRWRALRSTGDAVLCPVRALWTWAGLRVKAKEYDPVFRVPGQNPVRRGEVIVILRHAALDAGYVGLKIDTHSLRVGGATAMFAAGYPETEIQFLGRWASPAYLGYIHRATAGYPTLARDMFVQELIILRQREAGESRRASLGNKPPRPDSGHGRGTEGVGEASEEGAVEPQPASTPAPVRRWREEEFSPQSLRAIKECLTSLKAACGTGHGHASIIVPVTKGEVSHRPDRRPAQPARPSERLNPTEQTGGRGEGRLKVTREGRGAEIRSRAQEIRVFVGRTQSVLEKEVSTSEEEESDKTKEESSGRRKGARVRGPPRWPGKEEEGYDVGVTTPRR